MKVYIAFAHYDPRSDHMGYDEVLGVFTTKEDADQCTTDITRGDWWSVGEYEVQTSYLMVREPTQR
jgi:hypothetical protein